MVQSYEKNTTIVFLTYLKWFAISPTLHLHKVLPSLYISNINCNDNGSKLDID